MLRLLLRVMLVATLFAHGQPLAMPRASSCEHEHAGAKSQGHDGSCCDTRSCCPAICPMHQRGPARHTNHSSHSGGMSHTQTASLPSGVCQMNSTGCGSHAEAPAPGAAHPYLVQHGERIERLDRTNRLAVTFSIPIRSSARELEPPPPRA